MFNSYYIDTNLHFLTKQFESQIINIFWTQPVEPSVQLRLQIVCGKLEADFIEVAHLSYHKILRNFKEFFLFFEKKKIFWKYSW